jgi:hypothetical protein
MWGKSCVTLKNHLPLHCISGVFIMDNKTYSVFEQTYVFSMHSMQRTKPQLATIGIIVVSYDRVSFSCAGSFYSLSASR